MIDKSLTDWPSYTEEEVSVVSAVLKSNKVNYWTGTEAREFEHEFAKWVGASHSIAVMNGTVAIELALKGLNIQEGDEVIVTPRTFLASASAIITVGAKPVFVDVDYDSQNIEARNIESAITEKTRAVIVVHLGGYPADMDPIMELANKHRFYVIEDCAQAHGAKYRGRSVGSIGHVGTWSFCQDKIMTTGGEGGMVTTNNQALWRKMWSYKDHGKSYEAVYEREHPPGFRWLHESFGTNWRMTEMQAAIGRVQLMRMPTWREKRQANASAIVAVCSDFTCIRTPQVPDFMEHACYKHYCFVRLEELAEGWTRDRIVNEIVERGVPCMQGSCSEVYLEKAFDDTCYRPEKRLPVAKELGETSLMFLVHPTITKDGIEKTCKVVREVLSQAQG